MSLDLARLCSILQTPVPEPASALGATPILGVSTLKLAGAGDLCFAERDDQEQEVLASAATVTLVPESFTQLSERILVRCPKPREAFFRIAALFVPESELRGIHPTAVVHPTADIGADVALGAHAVIAAGAQLGERSRIGPGCYIGPGVTIGRDCVIEANATIQWGCQLGERCIVHSGAVIGGDGFGFRWDGQGHRKIPQIGRVVIEDDCDVGCNSCVDRATLGETRIRRGTKIDNLVQVAHNTDIGAHVILVSQCGVAGSSTLGSGVVVAGQVAISDHLSVGAGARIGGQSGVTKDVPPGAALFGTPARPTKEAMRELAALSKLPGLLKEIRRQSREIEELRRRLDALSDDESLREGNPSAPASPGWPEARG
jgi:UDP-3-O-[3-hydroxymyristoyl] glucosamine N-acyltransferase